MLTPEVDFHALSSVLVAAVKPVGDFLLLFPDFKRLFESHCTAGSLPGELSESVTAFTDAAVPSFITTLLGSRYDSKTEYEQIRTALMAMLSLAATGYVDDRQGGGDWLLRMMDWKADVCRPFWTLRSPTPHHGLFSLRVSSFL
jgi:hypothetical protein